MTKTPDEITKALAEPFPPQALKRRSDRGSTFTYVEGHTVFRRLIEATGNRFDVQVIDQSITPYGQTAKGADRVIITARVRLTIPELGSREHMGVQVTSIGSGEDLYKGAISDAIKKAATLFGVGLDLYGPDYEAGEIDDQPVSQRPAPARNAPQTRQDQRSAPEPSVHASDTDPRRASLLRAFHVALDGHDIPHDSAHEFFKRTRGFDSLTVVPDTELRGLMQTLSKLNHADAQDYIRTGITSGTLPGMPAPAAPRGRAGDDAHTR